MSRVRRRPLPDHALLARFARDGARVDCYVTAVPLEVTHADYVEAFYTSWLFRLERFILARLVSRPSTDTEASELAHGRRDQFAAWSVESRAGNQLVMLDFMSSTCSWLMVETRPAETLLYFGSGILSHGLAFRLLMPFHRIYSRSLLAAARGRLRNATRF